MLNECARPRLLHHSVTLVHCRSHIAIFIWLMQRAVSCALRLMCERECVCNASIPLWLKVFESVLVYVYNNRNSIFMLHHQQQYSGFWNTNRNTHSCTLLCPWKFKHKTTLIKKERSWKMICIGTSGYFSYFFSFDAHLQRPLSAQCTIIIQTISCQRSVASNMINVKFICHVQQWW